MGSGPTREQPFFFQKPTDAVQVVPPGVTVDHPYPSLTKNYHYEIELVAALGRGWRDIPVDQALAHVFGYADGLDMTRRDLQRAMGDEKKPWEIGKLSQAFERMPGDIIFSGTPENVGQVVRGDVMTGHIDRLPDLSVKVH